VKPLPADPILGLTAAFLEDKAARKVSVAQGFYRTDDGKPLVLPSVIEAERRVAAGLSSGRLNKEYLPIGGHAPFRERAKRLILGPDSASLAEGRVATLQTLSGTGAVSVGASTLALVGGFTHIWVPSPTWANHRNIFAASGLQTMEYTYLDKRSRTSLDFEGLKRDLATVVPEGSAVLLHACAHNPTGVDPSLEQWAELAEIFLKRGLVPFFDSAYQVRNATAAPLHARNLA
jgi:aspartate/tyrosine/aromatic aminotransferase